MYAIVPTLSINSYMKNPTANQFTLLIHASDLTPNIINNIQQYLSFNFPYDSLTLSTDNSTNMLSLTFDYSQSLNSG